MSTKELATRDIKEDLKKEGKCFIAFRKELNPVMRKLVKNQLKLQNPFPLPRKKTQLVAHCFFSKATNTVEFNNYAEYYGKV